MVKARVCNMMSRIHVRIQVSLISCERHGLPIQDESDAYMLTRRQLEDVDEFRAFPFIEKEDIEG